MFITKEELSERDTNDEKEYHYFLTTLFFISSVMVVVAFLILFGVQNYVLNLFFKIK